MLVIVRWSDVTPKQSYLTPNSYLMYHQFSHNKILHLSHIIHVFFIYLRILLFSYPRLYFNGVHPIVVVEHSKQIIFITQYNYSSILRYGYMFCSFTTIIRPSIQCFNIRYNDIQVNSLCGIPQVYNNYYNKNCIK
jgi:hypothetical protein